VLLPGRKSSSGGQQNGYKTNNFFTNVQAELPSNAPDTQRTLLLLSHNFYDRRRSLTANTVASCLLSVITNDV
jgi:hypothetical protein